MMNTINKNPEIRFKEFTDKWEEKELGSIAFFLKGKGISKADVIKEGKTPCIRYGELYTHYNETISEVISFTNKEVSELVLSRVNDVIIPSSGETKEDIATASCVLKEGVALGGDLNVIRTDIQGVYLAYYLNSAKKNDISNMAQGSSVVHLYPSQLKELVVSLPSLPEQQKTGSFFKSLDELVVTHKEELNKLTNLKKAMLSKMFPMEGEKVPEIRFKEFTNEWSIKTVNDIAILVRGPFGGALKKEVFVDDGYAVYEQFHAIYEDFSSYRYFVNSDKFTELNRFSVNSGDLIMSCSGTMGKFALIPQNFKKGIINQALLKITILKDFDVRFVKILMETENVQERLLSQSAGGAIKNVVAVSQIKEISLAIPSLTEQKRVAEYFQKLDNLISLSSQKIKHLENLKQAFLQKMFV